MSKTTRLCGLVAREAWLLEREEHRTSQTVRAVAALLTGKGMVTCSVRTELMVRVRVVNCLADWQGDGDLQCLDGIDGQG
jgi:hypothetical protein